VFQLFRRQAWRCVLAIAGRSRRAYQEAGPLVLRWRAASVDGMSDAAEAAIGAA